MTEHIGHLAVRDYSLGCFGKRLSKRIGGSLPQN
jgi:hypothetical protein